MPTSSQRSTLPAALSEFQSSEAFTYQPPDDFSHPMGLYPDIHHMVSSPSLVECRKLEQLVTSYMQELRRRLAFRKWVAASAILVLLVVHLVAAHPNGGDSIAGAETFQYFATAFNVLLVLVVAGSIGAHWLPANERVQHGFVIALRAIAIWGLLFVCSLSSLSRRTRILNMWGVEAEALAEQEACEEGATTQWIALLLGSVAVGGLVPFFVFLPLSQLICLQHLVLGLALHRPECDVGGDKGPGGALLGLPPVWICALQLHVLAGQFAVACWRCSADMSLQEFALAFAEKTRNSVTAADDDFRVRNWLELLVEEIGGEEVSCRNVLVEAQSCLPTTESTLATVSAVNHLASYLGSVTTKLQAQSSTIRATQRTLMERMGRQERGERTKKGIHGFIEQSFMVTELEDDGTIANELAQAFERQPQLPAKPAEDFWRFSMPMDRKAFHMGEWDFDALKVDAEHGNALPVVGYELLGQYHNINTETLARFLSRLDSGYVKANPYHMSVHAADVCNAMFYLVWTIGLWDHPSFTDTKRIAVHLAGLGHDVGHFGKTNHFLIATHHALARTYNDKSVLENFHCATLFSMLDETYGDAELGQDRKVLETLNAEAFSKARQLMIALILATDTQQHLEALAEFRLRLNAIDSSTGRSSFDALNNTKDQQEALCIMFRAADIGHAAKPWEMHRDWSIRVTEEFHQQGDVERELGLQISPLCDRRGFEIASSQLGFLQFICLPTWKEISRLEILLQGHLRAEGVPVDGYGYHDFLSLLEAPPSVRRSANSANSVDSTPSTLVGKHTKYVLSDVCWRECESNYQEWSRMKELGLSALAQTSNELCLESPSPPSVPGLLA